MVNVGDRGVDKDGDILPSASASTASRSCRILVESGSGS